MQLLIYQQLEWPRTVSLEKCWYRKRHKVDGIADVGDISKGLVKEKIVSFLIWGKTKFWNLKISKNQVLWKPPIEHNFVSLLFVSTFSFLKVFLWFHCNSGCFLGTAPNGHVALKLKSEIGFHPFLIYVFVCSPFSVWMLPHSNISSFYMFILVWCSPFGDKFCRTWIMLSCLFFGKQTWWNFLLNISRSWTLFSSYPSCLQENCPKFVYYVYFQQEMF